MLAASFQSGAKPMAPKMMGSTPRRNYRYADLPAILQTGRRGSTESFEGAVKRRSNDRDGCPECGGVASAMMTGIKGGGAVVAEQSRLAVKLSLTQ